MNVRTNSQPAAVPRTLLLPLDGSSVGERATEAAERIACATGARVVLVRAVPHINPAASHDVTSWTLAMARQKEALREARAALTKVAASLRRSGARVRSVVREGDPAEVILTEAISSKADLLVMGRSGRRGLDRWVLGSVADSVAREGTTPLLVVPAASSSLWQAGTAPRILVTLDGSSLAEAALAPSLALAFALGGEVHLLRVVDPAASSHGAALASLSDCARRWTTRGVSIQTHVGVGAYVADAILEFARRYAMNLLAIATHGRGGLVRLALGSVATEVVGASTLPVLLVRPQPVAADRSSQSDVDTAAPYVRVPLQ